jgi:hypothetical protein
VRLERPDGTRVRRALGRDDKVRKRGKLVLCGGCHEYIFAKEAVCPHCGNDKRPASGGEDEASLDIRRAIEAIERHGRRILDIADITGQGPPPT